MNHQEAYKILRLNPPFTEQQLKSAFRAKAQESHPDKGGKQEDFIKAKSAFDLLIKDAGQTQQVNTVDGTPLSELGKGLKVSGRTCKECFGKGYNEYTYTKFCYDCLGWGYRFNKLNGSIKCKTCNGMGEKVDSIARTVCFSCKGSGQIALFNPLFIKGSLSQKEYKRRKQ